MIRPHSIHLRLHPSSTPLHLHSFPTRRSSDLCLDEERHEAQADAVLLLERVLEALAGVDDRREVGLVERGQACGGALRRHERSEEHTSELQSHSDLVCRLLLEKKKYKKIKTTS